MEGESKTLEKFDFTKESDVIRALGLSAEHSANQTLPTQNITGLQRATNGAMRLAELKLRYQMFQEKVKKTGGMLKIPLLDEDGVGSAPVS